MRGVILISIFSFCLAIYLYDDFLFRKRSIDTSEGLNKNRINDDTDFQQISAIIANMKLIDKHNQMFKNGYISFKLKVNPFIYMPHEEFVKQMNGFKKSRNYKNLLGKEFKSINYKNLPLSIDWRSKYAVTPIKNQGNCGSCWAFSTIGSLESNNFIKYGRLISLSEQNLIDCSRNYGNQGCNGGSMVLAFKYIQEQGGIATESSYPYLGRDDQPCKFNENDIGARVTGYIKLQSGNETQLMEAVSTVGPVAVAIDASNPSFQFYSEGIYYEPNCSPTFLDHGVVVIGYGTSTNGEDYWLVKNSWGTSWGEKGYAKMARNRNNNCGIASDATYPLL